jgi:hypothetical protein
MQWFRQTLIWVTVLAANFSDAETVGAVPVDLVTNNDENLISSPGGS